MKNFFLIPHNREQQNGRTVEPKPFKQIKLFQQLTFVCYQVFSSGYSCVVYVLNQMHKWCDPDLHGINPFYFPALVSAAGTFIFLSKDIDWLKVCLSFWGGNHQQKSTTFLQENTKESHQVTATAAITQHPYQVMKVRSKHSSVFPSRLLGVKSPLEKHSIFRPGNML